MVELLGGAPKKKEKENPSCAPAPASASAPAPASDVAASGGRPPKEVVSEQGKMYAAALLAEIARENSSTHHVMVKAGCALRPSNSSNPTEMR